MSKIKEILSTLLFVIVCLAGNSQDRIAVIDFKAGAGITQEDVDGISSIFGTYFYNPDKFTLVERSRIDRVIEEQGFQRTTLTNSQIVRIGQLLNLQQMVVGDINIVGGQYNVDVRILNVESGAVEATEGATWAKGSSYRELMKNLAVKLMDKISQTTNSTNTTPAVRPTSVVTLLGYLHVYPEDLGQFSSIPHEIINHLNEQQSYGYNDWRIPTDEEISLMRANSSQIGLRQADYITSNWDHGFVRLVTTGQTVAEKRKGLTKKYERAKADGVLIAGARWAMTNVGNPGEFVDNIYESGNYYTHEEAEKVCPPGWRLPTTYEAKDLFKNYYGTTYDGKGIMFGSFDNDFNGIFLPASGKEENGTIKERGLYGYFWTDSDEGKNCLWYTTVEGQYWTDDYGHKLKGVLAGCYYSHLPVRCVRE